MDLFAAHRMAKLRLRQRAEVQPDGMVLVDPRDDGGRVAMSAAECQRCTDWFAAQLDPAARFLVGAIILQIPLAILSLAVIARLGVTDDIDCMFAGPLRSSRSWR